MTSAYGIVRSDRSGEDTGDHIGALRRFARHHGFDLRAILVEPCDKDFSLLLATFAPSGIRAVIVPDVLHVSGWLDAMRQDVDVWSLTPIGHWPRNPLSGKPVEFIPGIDR
ncbi:hypothetical protein [Nocardia sp. NPDC005978]|uniref:hypothetical protein n=1 Tax=unclassified Nocardia TaxID=2637762 RepID=UPI0033A21908